MNNVRNSNMNVIPNVNSMIRDIEPKLKCIGINI